MSYECNGDGFCLVGNQCEHRFHLKGYCPSNCPKGCTVETHVIKCNFCNDIAPIAILNATGTGNPEGRKCLNCKIQYGQIEKTDKIDECSICLQDKNMIKLPCSHLVCFDCWKKESHTSYLSAKANERFPVDCPLCRTPAGKYPAWRSQARGSRGSA